MTLTSRNVLACIIASCSLFGVAGAQGRASLPGRGSQAVASTTARTRVEIVELRLLTGPTYSVRVRVSGTVDSRQLQVVLFAQEHGENKFHLAADRTDAGQPIFPRISSADGSTSEWTQTFSSPTGYVPITVFAVVSELGRQVGSNREKEFSAVSNLPFKDSTTINQVLRILAEFDWRPNGYTYVTAPVPLASGMSTLMNGQGYLGGTDYRSAPIASAAECAQICSRELRCVAMTFIISQRTCWLKDRLTRAVGTSDMISARKLGQ